MSGEHVVTSTETPTTEPSEGTREPHLRLRSVVVHNFRDVQPGTKLELGDGFHLILGKNATGKSTLLQLLAAISVLNFEGPFFAETPFHLEASLELGALSLHVEIQRSFERGNRFLDFPPNDHTDLIVRFQHNQVPFENWVRLRSGEDLHTSSEDPRHIMAIGTKWKIPGAFGPLPWSIGSILRMGVMTLQDGIPKPHPVVAEELWTWNLPRGTGSPFDEALGALQTMAGHPLSFESMFGEEGFSTTSRWLPKTLEFNGNGEPVTLELSRDPFLADAIRQLGFEDAKAYFGPAASTNTGWRYSAPSFQFFRGGKPARRHDQLSFGQQRLFSFAWYLACNADIAIADELVNGLHSDWIEWCVQTLRNRQSFLTSQNPILVDSIPFRSKQEIQQGIILCESVRTNDVDHPQLRWRQLDDREADLISRAFEQSRLDLLSDLLHALELW